MKKLFYMLIVLFLLYLGIQFAFTLFSKGNESDYIITEGNMEFNIHENSYFINNENTYSYSIKGEDYTFNFQVSHNFNKLSNVLTKIRYYKDKTYECILPIFKNNLVLMDMMCYGKGRLTYYYNLKGTNKYLDAFVLQLTDYKVSQFNGTVVNSQIEGLTVFKENLINDHYIGITNYKGIYDISNNFNSLAYNISLYKKDVYNQKISAFVDEYFISADYDKSHEFNEFNVVDLVKLDTFEITSDKTISLDSYIQGVVDGVVYIFDKDNKTQYEINISKKSVVSYTGNSFKYYKDGVWTTMSLAEANKEVKFTEKVDKLVDNNYVRIDKIGNEVGYYYLYKKNGKTYDVYRKDIQNEESLIYLFSTKSIDNIYYIDDYVYFVNGNKLQVYSNSIGLRDLVQYKELEFNKNLSFSVYSK